MSNAESIRRRRRLAATWFAIALAGVLFIGVYAHPAPLDWLAIAIFFPTTSVGIGGGIGALHGRTMRGILLALGAEFVFANIGISLSIGGVREAYVLLFATAATATFLWVAIRLSTPRSQTEKATDVTPLPSNPDTPTPRKG